MNKSEPIVPGAAEVDAAVGLTLADVLATLRAKLWLLTLGPLAAGVLALGATWLIPPTFTAITTFIPPQPNQSAAAAALASLGTLGNLVGGAAATRTPADQYVALMRSNTVSDRLIERFKLDEVYEVKLRVDARRALAENVRISTGKRDGLLSVEVDDTNPQRAADLANAYVDELRNFNGTLALTAAQRRRAFFEQQMQLSRDRLARAQTALQASGFNPGAMKADPKAAAEPYARLMTEAAAAEVRLQTLRGSLADGAPEVRQQQAALTALRAQIGRTEQAGSGAGGPDYVGRYREFKYEEALFELYARQFELARVEESQEGTLIQVVDPATAPERKSRPRRANTALATTGATAALLLGWVFIRRTWRMGGRGDAMARSSGPAFAGHGP